MRRSVPVVLEELKGCRNLERGKQLYSEVVNAGLRLSSHSATLLLNLYSKCGFIDEARFIFDRLPCHSVISWTCLIAGYVDNGRPDLALELFSSCLQAPRKWEANAPTFLAALTACSMLLESGSRRSKLECLEKARWIHSKARKSGCDGDPFVANSLVDLYAKCGNLMEARRVFDQMRDRSCVSWTALMLGFAENGDGEIALELYSRVLLEGLEIDGRVFVAALSACGSLAARADVKLRSLGITMAIHHQAAMSGQLFGDIFVANALIDAYSKCGSMADASRVFGSMRYHDAVSWTSLILGFVAAGEMEIALQTYELMKVGGVEKGGGALAPTARTFVAALKACSCLGSLHRDDEKEKRRFLEKGREIHSEASSRGCDKDAYVATSLVAMYASCGCVDRARSIFDSIDSPNVVTWNAMIAGCVENGENFDALLLFQRMRIVHRLHPSAQTSAAVLEACAALTRFGAGIDLHGEICRAGLEDERCVATSLVDFYGKCGSAIKAQGTFDSMLASSIDTAGWSSLIAGYSRAGDAKRALDLFSEMGDRGVERDNAVILEVLTACSHAGLVDEGREFFARAVRSSKVRGACLEIEHYNGLIDMLGRANRLDEAISVARSMHLEPNLMTWRTILAACKKWNNVEIGKRAFDRLMELDEKVAASFVIMSSIAASSPVEQEITT